MHLAPTVLSQAKRTTMLLRNSFQYQDVKQAAFSADLGDDLSMFTYDSDGFCLVASCSFQQIMNSRDWQLMYIDEIWTYGPHHFLRHIPSGTVFDLTFDQYTHYGMTVPYELGRPIKTTKYHKDKASEMLKFLNRKFLQKD